MYCEWGLNLCRFSSVPILFCVYLFSSPYFFRGVLSAMRAEKNAPG